MPVFTTLEFFRSKQTISCLSRMYPKSMIGLREVLLNSLEDIDHMLTEISFQYLTGHKNHESYIREKTISLHLLCMETDTKGIYRKSDFEVLFDKANMSNALTEHINKIKEINKDISDFNPYAFTPIVELFEIIISCMEKYFLSFYKDSSHATRSHYMETPNNYENKRFQFTQEIKRLLRKIYNLSNQFNTQGLNISFFGEKSNYLARITKSMEMPCFLLFPESCDLIQESMELVRQWIETDKEYPKSIKMDIANMNNEKVNLEIRKRTLYEEFIKSRYCADQLERKYNEMCSVKDGIQTKLHKSEDDYHETLVKLKLNEMTIDKSEVKIRETQNKNNNICSNKEVEKEIEEQKWKIFKSKIVINENEIKLQRIKAKIKYYKQFLKKLLSEKENLHKSLQNCLKYKNELEEIDEKIDSINQYTKHLNSICALKMSNSTLKKIFYNLDFKKKLIFVPDKDHEKNDLYKDELSDAIQVTSQMIGKYWIKLYTNLSFHPPRGTTEIESDIEKFTKHQVRGLRKDLALQSLRAWRRFNIRANTISLVDTLKKIDRFDILDKLHCISKSKPDVSLKRIDEEKIPPMSATSKFLIKHYPNLQKLNCQVTE